MKNFIFIVFIFSLLNISLIADEYIITDQDFEDLNCGPLEVQTAYPQNVRAYCEGPNFTREDCDMPKRVSCTGSTEFVFVRKEALSGGTVKMYYREVSYHYRPLQDSCPDGSTWSTTAQECVVDVPTCTDSQYLDKNNTCQEKTLPTDFPDSSKKGITGIREVNSTSADCVAGTKIDSGIAHAQVIGFDSKNNKCIYATFFCNNGLTWNKVAGTCEIPPDETTVNPNNDDISSNLSNACKSGKWAKSWTNDYCGKPLCYIGLNEQDYNLQCGNKYIEYDCTSDYRLKFFKQVSCGNVAKSDFKKKTLSPSSAPVNNLPTSNNSDSNNSNIKNDVNVTTHLNDDNTTVTDYSKVVNIINGGLDNVDKSLGSLLSATSITNQKLSENTGKLDSMNGKLDSMNGKLDSMNGKLDSIDDKLSLFDDVKNLISDPSSIGDSINNVVNDGFDTYLNKDYTGGLATSSCPAIQTISMVFHGKTITIFSQDTINKMPMDIFRSMIIFMFVFSGIIFALRTS